MENKKKTLGLIAAGICLVLVAALFFGIYQATRPKPQETPQTQGAGQEDDTAQPSQDSSLPGQTADPADPSGAKKITIIITHGDGTTKTLELATDEDYLGPVLEAQNLVVFQEGPYGMYIHAVDGEKAVYEEDGAYWGLNVNGEYAMQGADQTPVNNGDIFELVYTIG